MLEVLEKETIYGGRGRVGVINLLVFSECLDIFKDRSCEDFVICDLK